MCARHRFRLVTVQSMNDSSKFNTTDEALHFLNEAVFIGKPVFLAPGL